MLVWGRIHYQMLSQGINHSFYIPVSLTLAFWLLFFWQNVSQQLCFAIIARCPLYAFAFGCIMNFLFFFFSIIFIGMYEDPLFIYSISLSTQEFSEQRIVGGVPFTFGSLPLELQTEVADICNPFPIDTFYSVRNLDHEIFPFSYSWWATWVS